MDNIKYSKIVSQINRMVVADQRLRNEVFGDKEVLTQDEKDQLESLDKKNTETLKTIIQEIGLPTISKVGKKASFNVWLVVQHSPDLEFQKKYLKLLKQHQNDVDPRNVAYLEDRVLRRQGKPQIYGTQVNLNPKTGKYELQENIGLKNLDRRRAEIGLESISEYLKRF